jgi:hypothetical protein
VLELAVRNLSHWFEKLPGIQGAAWQIAPFLKADSGLRRLLHVATELPDSTQTEADDVTETAHA